MSYNFKRVHYFRENRFNFLFVRTPKRHLRVSLSVNTANIFRFVNSNLKAQKVISFLQVFTGFIVMSCDAVEKAGKNFCKKCFLLQEGMRKSEIRDELMYLGTLSGKLSPSFSAAGFLRVNQLILSGLFSTATTYSIICIQFDLENKQKTMSE